MSCKFVQRLLLYPQIHVSSYQPLTHHTWMKHLQNLYCCCLFFKVWNCHVWNWWMRLGRVRGFLVVSLDCSSSCCNMERALMMMRDMMVVGPYPSSSSNLGRTKCSDPWLVFASTSRHLHFCCSNVHSPLCFELLLQCPIFSMKAF